jgi:hypothetical protein
LHTYTSSVLPLKINSFLRFGAGHLPKSPQVARLWLDFAFKNGSKKCQASSEKPAGALIQAKAIPFSPTVPLD